MRAAMRIATPSRIALLVPIAVAGCCQRVRWAPDGVAGSTPPHVVGRIEQVQLPHLSVRVESGNPTGSRLERIDLGRDVEIVTVYGGLVAREELRVGQHVRVWLTGCAGRRAIPSKAAALELWSRDPVDQPPVQPGGSAGG